jgi:hypothetical protein
MTEETEHCDFESDCQNFKLKCGWCRRDYDAEFADFDYFERKKSVVTENSGAAK